MALSREFYIPKNATQINTGKSDAVVYIDGLIAIGFHGKKAKYDWYLRFRTEERRNEYIQEFIQGRIDHKVRMIQRKKDRQRNHTLKPGQILVSSWGYDQTNVDYYQVLSTTDRTVIIQKIAGSITDSTMTADYLMPKKGAFIDEPPMKKIVDARNNSVKIESFAWAYPWGGTPDYQTNPMFGH